MFNTSIFTGHYGGHGVRPCIWKKTSSFQLEDAEGRRKRQNKPENQLKLIIKQMLFLKLKASTTGKKNGKTYKNKDTRAVKNTDV